MLFPLMLGACVGIVPTDAPAVKRMPNNETRTPVLDQAQLRVEGLPVQGALLRGVAPPGTRWVTLDGKTVPLAADGRFVIAFDRDAAPTARLIATSIDGLTVERMVAVVPRAWPVETIAGLPRFTLPSETFKRLRPAEQAQIAAARATATDAQGWRQAFRWPVSGRVSGVFGAQRIYANGERGDYHSGVDIAEPVGTNVRAPADGIVILAADHPFTLEGNLLMLDHGAGLNSAFLHLSRIDVKVGQAVRQGDVIGAIGMTGRATGPHLHWSMKWQDARIDPAALAGPMR